MASDVSGAGSAGGGSMSGLVHYAIPLQELT
jgi:hypothetical protein